MHSSVINLFQRFQLTYLKDKVSQELTIAELGSYNVNGTLRDYILSTKWGYVGFDIKHGPAVDVVIEPYRIPEEWCGKFDIVLSSQVVEHVPEIWKYIWNIRELMKDKDSICFITTPNTIEYHPYPVDCWRLWPDGMRALLGYANLKVLECYAEGIDTVGIARLGV